VPERATPPVPPSSTESPPWRRSRPRNAGGGSAFVGDVAIAELRTKLALAPDRLPEPPPSAGGSRLVWAGRITGVAVVVAVGFLGYRWGSSPNARFQVPHPSSHRPPAASDRALAATPQNPGGGPAGGLTIMNAVPAVYPPPGKATPPTSGWTPFQQLTVGPAPSQQTDEAAQLAISAADAEANAAVVISGLAPGSTVSAGREVAPSTWRVPVEDLPGASVTPPRAFVGTMDLIVELRLADNSVVDRKSLQLEWLGRSIAARPQPRQHDAAEIAQMVKKGAELMANGDVAAARLMYQRAAETGEATAAFALAESYDPLVLTKGGIPPDVGLAETWYAKARDLGSAQASERLERLTRWDGQ
jgi:TPR repeat protein